VRGEGAFGKGFGKKNEFSCGEKVVRGYFKDRVTIKRNFLTGKVGKGTIKLKIWGGN